MNRVVFISHSNTNLSLARRVAGELQRRGFGCRTAVDRLTNSESPLQAIARDLGQAHVAIVLLTSAAESSSQVLREVEWLLVHNRPILVVRPEKHALTGTLSELLRLAPIFSLSRKPPAEFWKQITAELLACGIAPEPVGPALLQPLLRKNFRAPTARVSRIVLIAAFTLLLAIGFWKYLGGATLAGSARPEHTNGLLDSPSNGLSPVSNQESLIRVTPLPIGIPREITNSLGMKFVLIPAGNFTRYSAFLPAESAMITLTKSYYLGSTEVNQKQFAELMGEPASYFLGELLPVDRASWHQAVEFCRRLSELPEERAAGRVYRLPTECEWEFASRAGSGKAHFFGEDLKNAERFVWFAKNSKYESHAVGTKLPNAWGLYDIYGNVSEWCSDWAGEYPPEGQIDPLGPESGRQKVIRGGTYYNDLWITSSTHRSCATEDATGSGFRIVCEQQD